MRPTQRTFTDVETKEVFRLHTDDNTHVPALISDGSKVHTKGTQVNGFYIAGHTSVTIKLNTGKIIEVCQGEFYNLKETEAGIIEEVTHKKYAGFKRFTKV